MLYFAHPLAGTDNKEIIIKLTKDNKNLIRGIKASTKAILNNTKGILVIAGDISPPDLVSYLPSLAEDYNVPYVFVESMSDLCETNDYKKPTTCCFLDYESLGKDQIKKEMASKLLSFIKE